MNKHFF